MCVCVLCVSLCVFVCEFVRVYVCVSKKLCVREYESNRDRVRTTLIDDCSENWDKFEVKSLSSVPAQNMSTVGKFKFTFLSPSLIRKN